mmetsp:Transcript_48495/g.56675  ORF Transcript_48495/g.56675 Transcript_48495/m.56675 type:complete len:166 (-) Transcript_48495:2470-2967(-)
MFEELDEGSEDEPFEASFRVGGMEKELQEENSCTQNQNQESQKDPGKRKRKTLRRKTQCFQQRQQERLESVLYRHLKNEKSKSTLKPQLKKMLKCLGLYQNPTFHSGKTYAYTSIPYQHINTTKKEYFTNLCDNIQPPPGTKKLLGLGTKFCLQRVLPKIQVHKS